MTPHPSQNTPEPEPTDPAPVEAESRTEDRAGERSEGWTEGQAQAAEPSGDGRAQATEPADGGRDQGSGAGGSGAGDRTNSGAGHGGSVRVDSWIWSVRLVKSRSLAATACRGGHVRVNGDRVKPSQAVRVGDEVRLRHAGRERIVVVRQLLRKRVGAPEAVKCYVDNSPPPPPREAVAPAGIRDRGTGRPTKRDRREMERLRGAGGFAAPPSPVPPGFQGPNPLGGGAGTRSADEATADEQQAAPHDSPGSGAAHPDRTDARENRAGRKSRDGRDTGGGQGDRSGRNSRRGRDSGDGHGSRGDRDSGDGRGNRSGRESKRAGGRSGEPERSHRRRGGGRPEA
ncbi:RNA-binding S4 domain-containing protein [Streptomyces physcomitrii]|uniref:RNA-binding S4 domain-containing protein n=1 Tax=Streptomyces physcomitrii TaxID=2724184 RepID=UPI0035E4069C